MNIIKKIEVIGYSISLVFLFYGCNAGSEAGIGKKAGNTLPVESDTAGIEFSEYEHDFGRIVSGEKVAVIFTFRNTGKAPLIINSVTTSCGCTVSKYSTKPVAPGETGTIEVVFDSSGYNGAQRKTITVMSNASRQYVLLQIRAEVISKGEKII
ncbi:MAG: DUF1573 domain-containing protein [Bacteroidales bacterium]|nr:DUF1573 domain-containing protein [Bacteroidales bacterium]